MGHAQGIALCFQAKIKLPLHCGSEIEARFGEVNLGDNLRHYE